MLFCSLYTFIGGYVSHLKVTNVKTVLRLSRILMEGLQFCPFERVKLVPTGIRLLIKVECQNSVSSDCKVIYFCTPHILVGLVKWTIFIQFNSGSLSYSCSMT